MVPRIGTHLHIFSQNLLDDRGGGGGIHGRKRSLNYGEVLV